MNRYKPYEFLNSPLLALRKLLHQNVYNTDLYYKSKREADEKIQESDKNETAEASEKTDVSELIERYDLPQNLMYADSMNAENQIEGELRFQQDFMKILPYSTILDGDLATAAITDQEKWKTYLNVSGDAFAYKQIIDQNRQNEFNAQVDERSVSETLRQMRNLQKYAVKLDGPLPTSNDNSAVKQSLDKFPTSFNNIQQQNKKVYAFTPITKFLSFYERPNAAEVSNLIYKNENILKLGNLSYHLVDMCNNQVDHRFGVNSVALRIFKPRFEKASLTNLKIYIIYMSNIIDVEESLADIIENVSNSNYQKITDYNQYQVQANEFLTLLTSPQSMESKRIIADHYQIKHLTFAKFWNFIKKYNIVFRNETKLTDEGQYRKNLANQPYSFILSSFENSDSVTDTSFSGKKAEEMNTQTFKIINEWLSNYAAMFRGYKYDALKEYIVENNALLYDRNIYEKMISNYDENSLDSSIAFGETMLFLTFSTFFSNIPSLPFRSLEDAVILKENVETYCERKNNLAFLEDIKKNAKFLYNHDDPSKQRTITEMIMVMGSMYSSQLAKLNSLFFYYKKCFELTSSETNIREFTSLFKSIAKIPKLNLYSQPKSEKLSLTRNETAFTSSTPLFKKPYPLTPDSISTPFLAKKDESPLGATAATPISRFDYKSPIESPIESPIAPKKISPDKETIKLRSGKEVEKKIRKKAFETPK